MRLWSSITYCPATLITCTCNVYPGVSDHLLRITLRLWSPITYCLATLITYHVLPGVSDHISCIPRRLGSRIARRLWSPITYYPAYCSNLWNYHVLHGVSDHVLHGIALSVCHPKQMSRMNSVNAKLLRSRNFRCGNLRVSAWFSLQMDIISAISLYRTYSNPFFTSCTNNTCNFSLVGNWRTNTQFKEWW